VKSLVDCSTGIFPGIRTPFKLKPIEFKCGIDKIVFSHNDNGIVPNGIDSL
jgi:hypothetical protein